MRNTQKIYSNFCTGVIEFRKSHTYPIGLTLDCLAFPDSVVTARICVRSANHGLSVHLDLSLKWSNNWPTKQQSQTPPLTLTIRRKEKIQSSIITIIQALRMGIIFKCDGQFSLLFQSFVSFQPPNKCLTAVNNDDQFTTR